MFLTNFSLYVRRAHDIGKSGYYLFIPFYNFVLSFEESELESNPYRNENTKDYTGVICLQIVSVIICAIITVFYFSKLVYEGDISVYQNEVPFIYNSRVIDDNKLYIFKDKPIYGYRLNNKYFFYDGEKSYEVPWDFSLNISNDKENILFTIYTGDPNEPDIDYILNGKNIGNFSSTYVSFPETGSGYVYSHLEKINDNTEERLLNIDGIDYTAKELERTPLKSLKKYYGTMNVTDEMLNYKVKLQNFSYIDNTNIVETCTLYEEDADSYYGDRFYVYRTPYLEIGPFRNELNYVFSKDGKHILYIIQNTYNEDYMNIVIDDKVVLSYKDYYYFNDNDSNVQFEFSEKDNKFIVAKKVSSEDGYYVSTGDFGTKGRLFGPFQNVYDIGIKNGKSYFIVKDEDMYKFYFDGKKIYTDKLTSENSSFSYINLKSFAISENNQHILFSYGKTVDDYYSVVYDGNKLGGFIPVKMPNNSLDYIDNDGNFSFYAKIIEESDHGYSYYNDIYKVNKDGIELYNGTEQDLKNMFKEEEEIYDDYYTVVIGDAVYKTVSRLKSYTHYVIINNEKYPALLTQDRKHIVYRIPGESELLYK